MWSMYPAAANFTPFNPANRWATDGTPLRWAADGTPLSYRIPDQSLLDEYSGSAPAKPAASQGPQLSNQEEAVRAYKEGKDHFRNSKKS